MKIKKSISPYRNNSIFLNTFLLQGRNVSTLASCRSNNIALLNIQNRMPFQKLFAFQISHLVHEQDDITLSEDACQKTHSVIKKT